MQSIWTGQKKALKITVTRLFSTVQYPIALINTIKNIRMFHLPKLESVFITSILIILIISLVYVSIVWIRRNRHPRERFALAALSSITALTLTLMAIIPARTAPWDLVAVLISSIPDNEISNITLEFEDYALLIFVYVFGVASILALFQRWDGLKSERQYKQEQRRENISLIREGTRELLRIIQRGDSLPLYRPEPQAFVSQLDVSIDSKAWRDRARTLIELKCPQYSFSENNAWHDVMQCWVGIDINTDGLVLMRCDSEMPSEENLVKLFEYGENLKSRKKKSRLEFIIALEDQDVDSNTYIFQQTVQIESEKSLLENLVNWRDYENDLKYRMDEATLPDSDFSISDVFVQPHCMTPNKTNDETETLLSYINKWLHEPGQRQLALLGDYGQGKSTTAPSLRIWSTFLRKLNQNPNLDRTPRDQSKKSHPYTALRGMGLKVQHKP